MDNFDIDPELLVFNVSNNHNYIDLHYGEEFRTIYIQELTVSNLRTIFAVSQLNASMTLLILYYSK